MSGKLYALGCSHTAGHSLDPNISIEFIFNWYKKLGVSDFDEYCNKYNPKIREKHQHDMWYPNLDHSINMNYPNNSYAAYLAKIKNLEYVNLAYSGYGIDKVVKEFKKIKNQITDKDIVITDCPPVLRYMTDTGKFVYNLHLTSNIDKFVPSQESMKIFYESCLTYLEKYGVHLIQLLPSNHQGIDFDVNYLNKQSLHDLCVLEMKLPRYPSGHMYIDSHKVLAKRLAELL